MRSLPAALALVSVLLCLTSATTPSRAAAPLSGPPGVIEIYAGGGTDDSDATTRLAAFMVPNRLDFSPSGDLYVTEFQNLVRKVSGDDVTRFAGLRNTERPMGDGGPALDAGFIRPEGLAFDSQGNLYIADMFNCAVRRVDAATTTITTVAGRGGYYCGVGGDDGSPATLARLLMTSAVEVDDGGQLYIAESTACRVRVVDVQGIINTAAGLPPPGEACEDTGDGGAAMDSHLGGALDLEVAPNGDVYVNTGCKIRRIRGATIDTVAGNDACGFGSDGSPANSLAGPTDIAIDPNGIVFIAEYECRIRMLADGVLTTVVGSPNHVCAGSGDGGLASQATIRNVSGIALDAAGNLYFTDLDAYGPPGDTSNRIRIIYGAAIDSDGDGYMDAAEAGIGEDPYSYCQTIRADVNRDGTVNSGDQLRVVLEQFHPSTPRFDQNADGKVNSGDVLAVLLQFGRDVSACP